MYLVLKEPVLLFFEYQQHMFWLVNNSDPVFGSEVNKKKNFHLHTLIWTPAMGFPKWHIGNIQCVVYIALRL